MSAICTEAVVIPRALAKSFAVITGFFLTVFRMDILSWFQLCISNTIDIICLQEDLTVLNQLKIMPTAQVLVAFNLG
jgi:hypothetical protein